MHHGKWSVQNKRRKHFTLIKQNIPHAFYKARS